MSNIIRDTVIYKGMSEYIPDDINSFTQMSMNEILTINQDLPDVDEILKVSLHPNIKDSKLVKTGIGLSLEGQKLTGYKYLSEGEFLIRVDYCADDSSGGIFSFKDYIFFNNATTLSENTYENSKITDSIYIEDIYAKKLSTREILINISFIFAAELY